MSDAPQAFLTPTEVAKLLRISHHTVVGWIQRGELPAVNVGNGKIRARYRVSRELLDEFLRRREVRKSPQSTGRRRQRCPDGGPLDPELGKRLAKQKKAALVDGTYYRVWNEVILFY